MIVKAKENPLITPGDVNPSTEGFRVLGAFNPGATQYKDEILLLLRVAETCEPKDGRIRVPVYRFEGGTSYPDILEFDHDDAEVALKDTRGVTYRGKEYLSTISHIRLARSKDGIHFNVEDNPFIYPVMDNEAYGVEDARVTEIDGAYYINYTAVSRDSWATSLAATDDFKSIERKGLIFHPENKDVAIFPEKVGGKYIALHRPNNSGFGKASIWYSESPDLLHWGNHQCIVRPRENRWESMKIGGGAPPIKTPHGWLEIYHGVRETAAGLLYRLGAVLLDLEEPWRVVGRASEAILSPIAIEDFWGNVGNVVFTCGAILDDDGELKVYYGAADQVMCLATAPMDEVITLCLNGRED